MRVLLVGYFCDPYRGSEEGMVWNWAWHLSEQHEVWLVTHPKSRDRIEHFLEINKRLTLNIRFVDIPSLIDTWRPQYGVKGVQLSYILWLKQALGEARRLVSEMPFDVIHHVGFATIAVPSPFWKLGLPFVWGPLGGGQKVPAQFRYLFGVGRASEWLREANIASLPLRPAFRKAVRCSSRVFAVNHETAAVLRKAGRLDVELFLDCGVTSEMLQGSGPHRDAGEQITVLWGGKLLPLKALRLAIEAMARLAAPVSAKLLVAGDGPCRTACQTLAETLGVASRVEFLGSVSLKRMYELMETSDVFVFTSVRDTSGLVLLEAAARKLAIIALNHQGVGAWLPENAGIKVAVEDPESTVRSLAAAIDNLARDPRKRCELGDAAYTFACRHTWHERARRMTAIYSEAVSAAHGYAETVQESVV